MTDTGKLNAWITASQSRIWDLIASAVSDMLVDLDPQRDSEQLLVSNSVVSSPALIAPAVPPSSCAVVQYEVDAVRTCTELTDAGKKAILLSGIW